MGAYAVSVEKEFQWRGQWEKTSNIYHYRITVPTPDDWNFLGDAVLARDRAAHTAAFQYKMLRIWGPTEGDDQDNKMRHERVLDVAGVRAATGPACYRELCAVSSIFVGRSPVKNRKIFVRKFVHLSSMHSSGSDGLTGLLSDAEITFWQDWMNSLKSVAVGAVTYGMVTPKDVAVPAGEVAKTLRYARIRQLRQ